MGVTLHPGRRKSAITPSLGSARVTSRSGRRPAGEATGMRPSTYGHRVIGIQIVARGVGCAGANVRGIACARQTVERSTLAVAGLYGELPGPTGRAAVAGVQPNHDRCPDRDRSVRPAARWIRRARRAQPGDAAKSPRAPRPSHRRDDVGRPGPAGQATFRGTTRSAEGQALAAAFNAMLDRLESARRDAARTALAAQEAERLRVARELHDEIGQTLTAVTLQAERAAEGDPAPAPVELATRGRRRPGQPRRGSPNRPRAAPRGARRSRSRECSDRAVLADRRPGRPCRRARASGHASAAVAARWSWSSTASPRRASPTRCATPAPSRQRCRFRPTPRRSTLRVTDDGRGCRTICPMARPGSPACASGRCWSAAGSRSSRGRRPAPRCGCRSRSIEEGDDRPAEDPDPARRRP